MSMTVACGAMLNITALQMQTASSFTSKSVMKPMTRGGGADCAHRIGNAKSSSANTNSVPRIRPAERSGKRRLRQQRGWQLVVSINALSSRDPSRQQSRSRQQAKLRNSGLRADKHLAIHDHRRDELVSVAELIASARRLGAVIKLSAQVRRIVCMQHVQ